MSVKLRISISIFALVAMLSVAGFASAQSTTGAQCTNGRLNPGDGSDSSGWGYCAPASCPNGAATCEGTVLCTNGTLNSGANAGQACTVAPAAAGALARDGVFGCSASKYQNIGSLSAMGGIYVPVNDAAVTLNTGYLVYKECVLDGVVSAIKNDAVSGLQRQVLKAAEQSREGEAQYLKNFRDLDRYFNAITVNVITSARSGPMCGAFRSSVTTAYARNYLASQSGGASQACTFTNPADRAALVSGTAPVNWSSWNNLIDPRGYEIGQYYLLKTENETALATYNQNIRQMLDWGRGVFPAFDGGQNPLGSRVITPGYIIADSLSQMIGAGTNILLNANEIDQVNGALQAGLTATLVSDTMRGLSGLSQSQNGQQSYLDRMAAESAASVRAGAVNAAISILAAARQIETQYKNAKEGTAAALTNAITSLRGYENQCWALVVPAVQQYASSQSATITVATTTEQFAQKVIDAQITPIATTTIRDLRASETALATINQLIASVTNTSSATNQRAALERLDTMVANNQLHSAQDAQNASKQRDDVVGALTILLDDTKKAWADSTDPNVGWCNVNNQEVITMWFNKWRQ